ncbi:hypothetical protein [Paenibacillus sp. Z6-24]
MKNRNIAFVSALTLTAALVVAPLGSASAAPVENSQTVNSTLVTSAYSDHTGSIPVGGNSSLLFLHGDFEVVINPTRYANFTITVFDNNNNPVSNMSYSGSSPYTLYKSDYNLRGYHYIKVTANVSNAGTFSVNY